MHTRLIVVTAAAMVLVTGVPGASAQTSSSLMSSDPNGQYLAIKQAMQQMYGRGGPEIRSTFTLLDDPPGYDLYHCANGAEFLGLSGGDGRTSALANLAFDTVIWRNNLAKLGYPAEIVDPLLSEYETARLAAALRSPHETSDQQETARGRFVERVRARLSDYRRSKPSLTPVVVEGGCGAGEVNVSIATEPLGAQVMFIPTFFYELCKAQRLDPDDTRRCNRWREAVDGRLSQVAGDYLYMARWPDGAIRRGTLSFTGMEDGQRVVLRKPQP
jgi:hypothetical protein